MIVSSAAWGLTFAAILAVFVIDFVNNSCKPREPTFRESARWSAFYLGLAVMFGVLVWWQWGQEAGIEYYAGYIIEKALSVDNLFVFTMIMSSFAVPRPYQSRLLMMGIVLALVLRLVFILAGSAVIGAFNWSFYIFGIVLILTAVNLGNQNSYAATGEGNSPSRLTAVIRRVIPTSEEYDGDRFLTTVNGERAVTPMTLALITIGVTAGVFGLDSILAVYGLTDETYIVFITNAFALMGLRELYFLIGGLLNRLVYLTVGLAIILGFLGVELILHALQKNSLPFINNGNPVDVPQVSTATAMVVIVGVLIVAIVASLLRTRDIREGDSVQH